MSTINCTEPCKYQKDGKCVLDTVKATALNDGGSFDCVYYVNLQNDPATPQGVSAQNLQKP